MYKIYTNKLGIPDGLYHKILLIMRLTTIICIASLIHVSAATLAQKITLSEKNAPLVKVFDQIRLQTGYDFIVTKSILQHTKPVSINVKNAELDVVLENIFKAQMLEYVITDKSILIREKEPSFLEKVVDALTPPADIRGRVLDDKGEPLAGASVKVKGTSKTATTNNKGEFFLQGVNENSVLLISYIGYQTKEIAASSSLSEIRLELSTSKLDEVQVIAYGTTTQRYNVGSVSKVTAEEIAQQPVMNPLAALAGRVPGLVITQTSGLAGSSFKVQIRGQNSLSPTGTGVQPLDNPLIVVDGVPFAANNSNINQMRWLASPGGGEYQNEYGGTSPLNSINPNDIESIEVLRDADATSIYGSRGSNGVILITIKKGKPGKLSLQGNVSNGASKVTRTMKMMDTKQFLEMRREALTNDNGLRNIFLNPQFANFFPDFYVYDTTRNVDWVDKFIGNTASTTDANISTSGGSSTTRFMLGSAYHRETSVFPGDLAYHRNTVNASFHHNTMDSRLSFDFSVNYAIDKNNSAGNAEALQAFTLAPDFPELMDSQGNLIWSYKGISFSSFANNNPFQYLKRKYSSAAENLLSRFQVSYQLLPELSLRSNFGYNTIRIEENSQTPISAQPPANTVKGDASFGNNNFKTWIIEPQVEYKKDIGNGKFTFLAGGTIQKNLNNSTLINASGYTNDAFLGSVSGAATTRASGGSSEYKYTGIFGRVNYTMANKYIINLSGRRDGSSRFGPGRQFGNFGSIGGGWIFSEESVIKEAIPLLSYGKLRGSFGTTGNDAIGDYQYLPTWSPVNDINYQGSTGYVPNNLFKPDYSWAITKKLEFGVELGLNKDKILLNIDWYRNRCGNQLVNYQLPTQTGFSNVTQNFPGLVENSGWDFQLNTILFKTKEFSWNTSVNLTIPKNMLVAFPGIESSPYSSIYIVGQSLSVINKLLFAGVNPTTGIFEYQSANGPTIAPDLLIDKQIIGNLDPKFYGGLKTNFSYKRFQLDLFFEFKKQLGVNYLYSIYSGGAIGRTQRNLPAIMLSRWQNPGDQSDIQRFSTSLTDNGFKAAQYLVNSSGVYSDASFIRFKTASLSYSFNDFLLKKIKMQGCRLYVNAQNLFTITKYKGPDPETQSLYGVPPLKTVVAGVQFSF
ncbi:TonB-linked SusC/RagA family outer membrane protein [Pedobacter sp. AK017]|uniref:SusC/RagA family TonB-linked outer membrane protein n=1 Tax=Pedobacter sp. AK017 TaxID=2723073 RepID=UPI00161D1EBB|nr:SusC/RagA family TonB-linked outer membrane protein [Pedobacter sp. AK017]MBB5440864.1 TonB-linked SusC/RagA family outer membrane protein [Pedobacter sp. AK017]